MPDGHHARLTATTEAVAGVTGAFDAFCASEALPDELAWRFRVALDEVIANIAVHGGGSTIDVWFRRNGDSIEVTVADDGRAFDPLARPDPDVTALLDARQPGGLGIMLVKSLMDAVTYERTGEKNVLIMSRRLDAAPHDGNSQS